MESIALIVAHSKAFLEQHPQGLILLGAYNIGMSPFSLLPSFPPSLPPYLLPSLPPYLLPSLLPSPFLPSFLPSLRPSLPPSLPPYLPSFLLHFMSYSISSPSLPSLLYAGKERVICELQDTLGLTVYMEESKLQVRSIRTDSQQPTLSSSSSHT